MPAKAGIQKYPVVTKALDPGFRRGDDVLQVHQGILSAWGFEWSSPIMN
jgi:hypothetical protein